MSSFQLEDDDFSLVEASVLAFLAEYDMVNVISSKTIDSPPQRSNWISSSEQVQVRKKHTWHQRQKAQVHRTREVINQLSAQLQELKNAAKVRRASSGVNKLTVKRPSMKTSGLLMWKRIAKRQFMLRQTSEIENIKLRKAVRFQFRQAKSFQRALRKRIPEDTVASLTSLISATTGFEQDLLRSGARHA
ncbi:hypothetical protein PC121_g56 [Phytophthora cactorum]|nr:hypothetical protein PC121_g56 [Phytophthora cactorum]